MVVRQYDRDRVLVQVVVVVVVVVKVGDRSEEQAGTKRAIVSLVWNAEAGGEWRRSGEVSSQGKVGEWCQAGNGEKERENWGGGSRG